MAAKAGVRRLRVRASAVSSSTVEVWLDPAVRFSRSALEALEGFERVVGGGSYARARGIVSAGRYIAAARVFAQGAVPVRTRRPIDMVTGAGSLEDVAVRLEKLDLFPQELVAVPAGLQRVPHPWEVAVAASELEQRVERGERP